MVDSSVEIFTSFFRGFKTFSQLRNKEYNFTPMRCLKSTPTVYVDRIAEKAKKEKEEAAKMKKGKKGKAGAKKGAGNRLSSVRGSGLTNSSEADGASQASVFDLPPRLKHPDFIDLQDYANPILRIELLLG
jgi:hypothetical protein